MPVLDDHGAASVGVVSGPVAQLLEQNYAILNQFKQNMAQYKVGHPRHSFECMMAKDTHTILDHGMACCLS